jgi:hypothetical protein
MSRNTLAWLAMLAASGCARPEPPTQVDKETPALRQGSALEYGAHGELLNRGTLCLFQGKPETRDTASRAALGHLSVELSNGEDLYVGVSPIRAGGCARVTAHSCVVEREAGALRVRSSLATASSREPCTAESAEAGTSEAVCRIPKLAAGNYTLQWGGRSLRFAVPSTVAKLGRCLYDEGVTTPSRR